MSNMHKSFCKYGLICGAGREPLNLAKTLTEAGCSVFVIKIFGEADADYTSFYHVELNLGQLNKMVRELKHSKCTEVILSGKINNQGFIYFQDNETLKRNFQIPIIFINPFDSHHFHSTPIW